MRHGETDSVGYDRLDVFHGGVLILKAKDAPPLRTPQRDARHAPEPAKVAEPVTPRARPRENAAKAANPSQPKQRGPHHEHHSQHHDQ